MEIWVWIAFLLLIFAMLALDLGVFNRKAHVVGMGEALAWTGVWVALALAFNVGVYFMYQYNWMDIAIGTDGIRVPGKEAALDFFTGYLIEKSLSLDNIFVIAMIFSYFSVPLMYQHRVLFWGILGALVMRGVMIAAGVALVRKLDWIFYVFGAFLIVTAIKMFFVRQENLAPEKNPLIRFARRSFPVTQDFDGQKFFSRVDGKKAITPLFLALIMVESSDVLFAVDSIPAIFAITTDPFLVFTSNIFAILGLRSLYFALAALMEKFRFLKISLVFLLAFVGVKMILAHHYPISTKVSLAVIVAILLSGVAASLLGTRRNAAPGESSSGK